MLNIPSEIKTLLNTDSVRKNFRVCFPNGEHSDLTASNINGESVSFTESICSQNSLKFGLCESPYIEFECVNVGDITGATIECYCEIFCPSTVSGAVYREDLDAYVYPIPFGRFIVDEAEKQADKGHRKVVAYSGSIVDGGSPSETIIQNNTAIYNAAYQYDLLKRVSTFFQDIPFEYTENDVSSFAKGTMNATEFISIDYEDGYIGIQGQAIGYRYNTHNDYIVKCYPFELVKTKAELIAEIEQTIPFLTGNEELRRIIDETYNFQFAHIEGNVVATKNPESKPVYLRCDSKYNSSTYYDVIVGYGYEIFITVDGTTFYDFTFANYSDTEIKNKTKICSSDFFGLVTKSSARKKYKINGTTRYKVNDTLTLDDVLEIGSACIGLGCNIGRINRDNSLTLLNLAEQTTPEEVTNFTDVWYKDNLTKPYGAVGVTWKDSGNADNYSQLFLTGYNENTDPSTYQTYDLSDNYLIKNSTWTEAKIDTVLQNAAEGLEGLRYMPMELTIQGRPDIQAGDLIEVEADDETLTTIVMQRTLTGIQSLFDDIASN